MSSDDTGPQNLNESSSLRDEADHRLLDAMLESISVAEDSARERRMRRALDAIGGSMVESPVLRRSIFHSWSRVAGAGGAGLAAAIAIAVVLGMQPGAATAESWFERAVKAAASIGEEMRGFDLRIVPHDHAVHRGELRGRVIIQDSNDGERRFRMDVEEPEERRHSMGIDDVGGWILDREQQLRDFPARHLSRHLLIGGVDLLIDPLPSLLVLVQRDYDIVEMIESPQPRLVARHRDGEGDPMAPSTVDLTFNPETWRVESLVLKWDAPESNGDRPGMGQGRRGQRGQVGPGRLTPKGEGPRRPGGPPRRPGRPVKPGHHPGADSKPGGPGDFPFEGVRPTRQRPGGPAGPGVKGPPPPPAEVHFVRTAIDSEQSIGRDSS